jgi:hypothetical protein
MDQIKVEQIMKNITKPIKVPEGLYYQNDEDFSGA